MRLPTELDPSGPLVQGAPGGTRGTQGGRGSKITRLLLEPMLVSSRESA